MHMHSRFGLFGNALYTNKLVIIDEYANFCFGGTPDLPMWHLSATLGFSAIVC